MSIRRVILIAAALLLLGEGVALYVSHKREPRYLGRTTRQWFADFRAAKRLSMWTNATGTSYLVTTSPSVGQPTAWFIIPGNSGKMVITGAPPRVSKGTIATKRSTPPVFVSRNSAASVMASFPMSAWGVDRPPKGPSVNALRALGTNAVPYLARQLQRQDIPLALVYAGWYNKFPQVIRRIAPEPPSPRREIRSDAALALSVLGRDALPAVPALLQTLKNPGLWERSTILQTLRELPFEPAQADPILDWLGRSNRLADAMGVVTVLHLRTPGAGRAMISALSSPDVRLRQAVVAELWSVQRAEGVVPALARALKDSDAQVRQGAARALERWQPRPSAALPALIEALRTTDDELRYLAARTLAEWGTNAGPALEALLEATNDTSVIVRNAATRGVRRIRGQGD